MSTRRKNWVGIDHKTKVKLVLKDVKDRNISVGDKIQVEKQFSSFEVKVNTLITLGYEVANMTIGKINSTFDKLDSQDEDEDETKREFLTEADLIPSKEEVLTRAPSFVFRTNTKVTHQRTILDPKGKDKGRAKFRTVQCFEQNVVLIDRCNRNEFGNMEGVFEIGTTISIKVNKKSHRKDKKC